MMRRECPACRSTAATPLVKEAYTSAHLMSYLRTYYRLSEAQVRHWLEGADYEVVQCDACELSYQTLYPGPELATELYDRWIDQADSRDSDLRRPSVASYAPILQEVVALTGFVERSQGVPLHAVKVLDYGMGWGSWVRMARAFGVDAYGYEVSPTRIAHAASLGIPCLNDAGLADQRFHIINVEQVLEHVPDPGAVVERLVKLLTPEGLLKISVPNGKHTASALKAHGAAQLLDPDFVAIRPLEHVNAFTPRSLRRLVERHGLRVRREPVRHQFRLISGESVHGLARSLGRPFARGILGVGTSLVLSR